MPENETIRKQIVSIDVDTAASKRVKQATAALKADFDALVNKGRALHEAFITQGAAANRLNGQIANLNDAYREGRIDLAQYQKENARLNADLHKADASFGATTQAVRETDNAIKNFYKDVKAGAAGVDDPTKAVRANLSTMSRTSSAIGSIGRGASAVMGTGVMSGFGPAQQITQAIYGVQALQYEFPKLSEKIMQNKLAVAGLGGALGLAGLAVYGLTELQKKHKEELEQIKTALQETIDKTKEYYALVQTATTADLQKAIEDKKTQLATAQAGIETTQAMLDQAQAAMDEQRHVGRRGRASGGKLAEPVTIGDQTITTFSGLQAAIDGLSTSYDKQTGDIVVLQNDLTRLQGGFRDARVLVNDFRTVLDQATRAYVDTADKTAQYALEAKKLSAQQIRDRVADLHREYFAYDTLRRELEPLAATSPYAAQALADVNAHLADLTLKAQGLYGALPAATKTENQEKAADILNNIIGMATQGAGVISGAVQAVGNTAATSSQKLDEYRAHMAEVEEDRLRQSIREEEDAARSRTRAITDHYLDLAKLDEQYYEKRQGIVGDIAAASTDADQEQLKTLRETNQAAIEAARAHSQRLIDIQDRTNLDIRKAALHLDAVGIWEAQKAGEQELKQEARQYNEEQRQRDADTRDRLKEIRTQRDERIRAGKQTLRDLETQHTKERGEQERTFQAQLRREDQDRAIRQQRQQQDWALQDQRYRDHNGIVESANSQHYGTMYGQTVTGLANVSLAFGSGLAGLVTIAQQALAAPPASSYRTGGSQYTPTAYAGGGTPPVNRDVWVGEHGRELVRFMQPARVYSHGDSQQMTRPLTFSFGDIVVQGGGSPHATARAVKEAAIQALYEVIQGLKN